MEALATEFYKNLYTSEGVQNMDQVLSTVPTKVTPAMNDRSRARAVARSRRLLQCVGARVVALRLATATTIRGGRGMTVFLFTAMVLQVVVGRLLLQLPTLDCPNSPQM